MRGPLNRSLAVATSVALAALLALAAIAGLALERADRLIGQLNRSQTQLALANRIEGDATGLMIDRRGVGGGTARSLMEDLQTYGRSIDDETAALPAAERAGQAQESARARALQRLAVRLTARSAALGNEFDQFRSIIAAVIRREDAEAINSLSRMHRLQARATVLAIVLPLLLCSLAIWFLAAMRRGVSAPLAALAAAAERIGSGDASPVLEGFSDFTPLARAISQADTEIRRQRIALERANRSLEADVEERTAVLARQNTRLAEIDRTRRLFFSQVGHELRTPVTVIRGEAEVALRDPTRSPELLRDALDQIVATGAFLGRRIDDLLAVARSEDGRLTIEPQPTDLAGIAREVQRTARAYAASMGAALTLEVEAELIPIQGDPSWLQQALLALVDNAVKYGGGSSIAITVGMREGDAVASVVDSGPGVPADALPRLFDAWYGPANSTRGAGLGLAVARWVAEAHGGSIIAENGKASGLQVTLRVPAS